MLNQVEQLILTGSDFLHAVSVRQLPAGSMSPGLETNASPSSSPPSPSLSSSLASGRQGHRKTPATSNFQAGSSRPGHVRGTPGRSQPTLKTEACGRNDRAEVLRCRGSESGWSSTSATAGLATSESLQDWRTIAYTRLSYLDPGIILQFQTVDVCATLNSDFRLEELA